MKKKMTISVTVFTLLMCLHFSCSEDKNPVSSESGYNYEVPEQATDGWITASMTDVGMDTEPVSVLMNDLLNRDDDFIHSLLIIKNGNLVFEEYFAGHQFDLSSENPLDLVEVDFDKHTLQFQASVSKSITSALVGIAIDQGLIQGVDEELFSFFPDYQDLNIGEKSQITLHHLLTMTSGLPWYDDDIDGDDSDEVIMLLHEDPIRFILDRPLNNTPGTYMEYNSGSTVLLGEIVRRVSGMDLHEFAKQYLFTPLGITNTQWTHCKNAEDITSAGGGLYMRPRDMAKFGQLYLQEGMWNGQSIISTGWIGESVQNHVISYNRWAEHFIDTGYGYQWWLAQFDVDINVFTAMGFGGQYILVFPEKELVIVITGGNYEANSSQDPNPFIIFDYIVYDHILTTLQ